MIRKLTFTLIVMLFTVPVFAQTGTQRRAPTDDIGIVVRVINYQDLRVDDITVAGTEIDYDLLAFGWTTPFIVSPGQVNLSGMTNTGQTLRVSFDAAPGDIYEVIIYDNQGRPAIRAFEYGDLLGSDVDLSTQSPWMRVNLFDDVRAIDVLYDGREVMSEITYGEAAVAEAPLEIFTTTILNSDTGEVIAEFDGGYGEPYYISVSIFDGTFADDNWFLDGYSHVYADPITYLRDISRYNIRDQFTVFLGLVDRAGMTEEIRTLTDVQLFVPDDEALLALGDDIPRDDPAALREFIRSYITEDQSVVFLSEGETNTAESVIGTEIMVSITEGDRYVNKAPLYYNYFVLSPYGNLQLAILDGAFLIANESGPR
jgi:hypothetical protein